MNTSTVFLAAFWSSLAAPASLYASVPTFRPAISDLSSANSFALVCAILNRAYSECVNDRAAATTSSSTGGQQLSFDFTDS